MTISRTFEPTSIKIQLNFKKITLRCPRNEGTSAQYFFETCVQGYTKCFYFLYLLTNNTLGPNCTVEKLKINTIKLVTPRVCTESVLVM